MKQLAIALALLVAVSLSGCFVEGGEGGTLDFEGEIDVSDGNFAMNGHLEYDGWALTADSFRSIVIELYTEDGTLLHRESIGEMRNSSEQLDVAISFDTIPYYIIIDSPDIWGGSTDVPYYVRSEDRDSGYERHLINERSELPITPEEG